MTTVRELQDLRAAKLALRETKRKGELLVVLNSHPVRNEDGVQWRTFDLMGFDSADFGTISRKHLEEMLTAAYNAGRKAR